MFVNPDKVVESLEILPGVSVADLGTGSGFYALAAAKLVGENGRVYAVDIQKELLPKIKKEAESRGLLNVEIIWGDAEKPGGTKLADSSIDVVIASNILFQVEDKESFIKEVFRLLKPEKGKCFIVDWKDSFGGIGPASSDVVSPETCRKLFLSQGFEYHKEFPTGPHHYGIAFRKI